MHARRFEKLDQISSGEQVELEYPEYLLHGTAQFCFESEIGKEQIDAKRDPDLGQNRVGGSSKEGLDLQVLLDPLEEQLDLPSFFVNFGDFPGLQVVRVGDKPVVDAGFRIGISHQAQRLLHPFEPNGLVVGDAGALSPGPLEQVLDIGVAFQSGHEENVAQVQVVVPAIIGEAAIETGKRALGQLERSGPVDFVLLAFGRIHEDRKMAVRIQPDVEFDGTLFLPELGPGEGRKAEVDDRGIEQVELACKREFLFRSHQLTTIEQSGEQRLEERRRLFGVHSRKGCLAGLLHAQMVQPFALSLEIVGDVTEAFSSGKLPDQQGQELTPTIVGTEFLPGVMCLGQRVEFISRHKYKQLLQDGIALGHGSDLLGLYDLFAKHCTTKELSEPPFLQYL